MPETSETTIELNYEGSKPPTTLESASNLLERLYPQIEFTSIKELDSYDDRNYLISTVNEQEKYVLKVTNSVDTASEGLIEGQNEMMLHLGKLGDFQIPLPLANANGEYISREKLSEKTFAVRLLKFVPGKRLIECDEVTPELLVQCGEYLARLQIAMNSGYENETTKNRNYFWRITNAPLIRRYLYVLDGQPERQNLVEQILSAFDGKVLAKVQQLPHSYIHHDFNEQNILVSGDNVSGVIDFGDICYTARVFDLSVCIAYAMLVNFKDLDPVLEAPKYILQGFLRHIKLTSEELSVLLLGSAARLSQSVTLGAYTHSLQPENTYLLATQANGWKVLGKLMQTDHEQLVQSWIR